MASASEDPIFIPSDGESNFRPAQKIGMDLGQIACTCKSSFRPQGVEMTVTQDIFKWMAGQILCSFQRLYLKKDSLIF